MHSSDVSVHTFTHTHVCTYSNTHTAHCHVLSCHNRNLKISTLTYLFESLYSIRELKVNVVCLFRLV